MRAVPQDRKAISADQPRLGPVYTPDLERATLLFAEADDMSPSRPKIACQPAISRGQTEQLLPIAHGTDDVRARLRLPQQDAGQVVAQIVNADVLRHLAE